MGKGDTGSGVQVIFSLQRLEGTVSTSPLLILDFPCDIIEFGSQIWLKPQPKHLEGPRSRHDKILECPRSLQTGVEMESNWPAGPHQARQEGDCVEFQREVHSPKHIQGHSRVRHPCMRGSRGLNFQCWLVELGRARVSKARVRERKTQAGGREW